MEYIDKFAIKAEIERWVNGWSERLSTHPQNPFFFEGGIELGKNILYFLDTLEVKEVDLVEEFADFLEKENAYVDDNNVISYYNGSSFNHTCDIYPIAKHFFELGLNARKEE